MSYPPYNNGPRGNAQQPNNPYQNGPFPQQPPQPQQPGPYGGGPAAPRPPYGAQPPYGGGQPPYGAGRPPYGAQPPQGGGMPPYGGGQPPFGGGPGGPGMPGGPGGPGGPRGSKKGLLIALGVVLVLVVGGVAVAAAGGGGHHSSAGGNGGTSGGTTTSDGGTSWSPPSWATKANDIGAANPSTVVQGTVWIAKQHPQNLASYAAQVGMPGTPDYHKYLTPDQFNSTFVNVQDASSAVTQWLQQDGMTVVSQDAQSIIVKTTLDKVESTLKVQIDRFKHNGRVDIAPTSQPQYPSNVGDYVSSVTGLTTSSPVASFAFHGATTSPKKKGKVVAAGGGKYGPGGATGIDTQWCSTYWGQKHYNDAPDAPWGSPLPMHVCGYTASQMRHAYGVSASGLTGKGVTVAVVDAYASPTIVQDMQRYNQEMGLPQFAPGQFTQKDPTGGYDPSTTPEDVSGWAGEETMDIEAVHMMAPDAKIVYYGARSTSQSDFDNAMEDIVTKHAADIVSCSWGGQESQNPEEEYQADTQIFQQGAVEGIGFNFASMDNGDYTAPAIYSSDPHNTSPTPAVAFPASDPFATGVGGTSLGINADGSYGWESGWGDWNHPLSGGSWGSATDFTGGAGGGNSKVFPQPDYQKGVVPDALANVATGTAQREVPDVSLDGDGSTGILEGMTMNGTVSVNPSSGGGTSFSESGGQWGYFEDGGTSLATPLFSGIEALAQQAAGGTAVGFVNPVLYKLVGSPALHDIVGPPTGLGHEPGTETWDQNHNPVMEGMDSDTSLKTAQGYDDITGVGSVAPSFLTWFKDHPSGQ